MYCSQHLQALSRNFYLTLSDLSRTTDLNLDCVFVKTHLFSFIQKLEGTALPPWPLAAPLARATTTSGTEKSPAAAAKPDGNQ